ncbi:MAG: hypothetical protein V4561_05560 [Bacteroidota bacterium]
MTNKDFDNSLREIMKEGHLPYEAEQWEKLAKELNKEKEHKAGILINIAIEKWSVYLKPILAIASGIIGFVLYTHFAKSGLEKHQIKHPIAYQNNFNDKKTSNIDTTALTTAVKAQTVSHLIEKKQSSSGIATFKTGNSNNLNKLIDNTINNSIAQNKELTQGINDKVRDSNKFKDDYALQFEEIPSHRETVYFDLLGGYNVNNIKNSFNFGINLRKNVYKKLRLEASIALVGGYNKTYKAQEGFNPADSFQANAQEQFESTTNNIFYLQAAPSISYELLRGFYFGWGLDAQKLINSASKARIIDDKGTLIGSQPLWDFGTLLTTNYQVSTKINAGIMYRKSLVGINQNTTHSVSRDYLMMQMSVRIN